MCTFWCLLNWILLQVSLHAKQLIYQLLQKNPKDRLGACEGANEIKRHPFFRGMNWALVRCVVKICSHFTTMHAFYFFEGKVRAGYYCMHAFYLRTRQLILENFSSSFSDEVPFFEYLQKATHSVMIKFSCTLFF